MTTTEDRPRTAADGRQRADILSFASRLCGHVERRDALAVSSAAAPLLEWAEEAASKADLRLRMEAMWRQHQNSAFLGPRPAPAEFVAQAQVHYDFLTGGK